MGPSQHRSCTLSRHPRGSREQQSPWLRRAHRPSGSGQRASARAGRCPGRCRFISRPSRLRRGVPRRSCSLPGACTGASVSTGSGAPLRQPQADRSGWPMQRQTSLTVLYQGKNAKTWPLSQNSQASMEAAEIGFTRGLRPRKAEQAQPGFYARKAGEEPEGPEARFSWPLEPLALHHDTVEWPCIQPLQTLP